MAGQQYPVYIDVESTLNIRPQDIQSNMVDLIT